MEISTHDEEGDPPLLIDSGTESYNESPVGEEDAQQSDTFVLPLCQSEDFAAVCKGKVILTCL